MVLVTEITFVSQPRLSAREPFSIFEICVVTGIGNWTMTTSTANHLMHKKTTPNLLFQFS
jgi:hypothetical protein